MPAIHKKFIIINFLKIWGKLINLNGYITGKEKYATDKKAKEEAEKLAEERMQAYTDFLVIIENLKKMDNRKEMDRTLAEIAKAALRKLPREIIVEILMYYSKKFLGCFKSKD
ncbi:MAG: hypothetical protein COT31_00730 [Candidatus Moranbacteria bacterium CG08_land_8_20_14_0_20_34_16]|nr:MAG: hypothetical protein COT31_00730 [Candidatus Moranbacteria bacterium CG08_land_8_20_14_0_20_34_16]